MTEFNTHITSLLSTDRILNLIKYSQFTANLNGYIMEMGTFSGGSLEILAKYNPSRSIIALDSFEGVPLETEGKDYHRLGDFGGIDFHAIAGFFKMAYPQVRLIKGFIPKVFEYFDEHTRLAFTHIDLDMYQSIKDALDFALPRTLEGGIILLDDFRIKSTPGCESAIIDFFAEHETEVNYRGELKYWYAEDAPSHNQYIIIK